MLTSLAATAAPAVARSASNRTSPASRLPRSANDGKNGKSARIVPSRQQPRTSTWPGAQWFAESTRSARPTPNADSAGGPSVRVRWPPTTGTSYSWAAQCSPRSTSRATASEPTTVSSRASGRAPMAARSLTLASTAAMPAP